MLLITDRNRSILSETSVSKTNNISYATAFLLEGKDGAKR